VKGKAPSHETQILLNDQSINMLNLKMDSKKTSAKTDLKEVVSGDFMRLESGFMMNNKDVL